MAMHIGAMGMVTALGLDVDTTLAAMRAGLDAFRRLPVAADRSAALQAAPIVGFAEGVGGVLRHEALALQALAPCLEGLDEAARLRVVVFVGLPADRPGRPAGLVEQLPGRLARALQLEPSRVHALPYGRMGTFGGLMQAREHLKAVPGDVCIVGGVDVLTNGDSLRGLSQQGLIKDGGDGFIPGEAAAFVRLHGVAVAGPWGGGGLAVSGLGVARDPAKGDASDPLTGRGVVESIRQACRDAGVADHDLGLIVNDVNGQRQGFEDHAMGQVRFFRTAHHVFDLWHVASHLGETGAAAGAIQLCWAAAALAMRWTRGPSVLVTHSDGDLRGAAVVSPQSSAPAVLRVSSHVGAVAHTVRPGRAGSGPAAVGAIEREGDDLHAQLAQTHARELAWLWSLRDHHLRSLDVGWLDVARYEARLLAHLDALAWSDDTGVEWARMALQGEEPDALAAALSWALAFSLESGRFGLAVDALRRSDAHVHALSRVLPHAPPAVAQPLMQRLASSADPRLLQVGLRAMATARWTDADLLTRRWHEAPREAMPDFIQVVGVLGLRDFAGAAVEQVRQDARLGRGGLAKAALLSLGLNAGDLDCLRPVQMLREAPIAAALWCLQQDVDFADLLVDVGWNLAIVDACGWAGETRLVPQLLALLGSVDPTVQLAAHRALVRIHGPLATPSEPGVSPSGEVWSRAIAEAGWPEVKRRRLGQPWHATRALHQLSDPQVSPPERQIAAWEHAVLNQRGLPLSATQFVSLQQQALAAVDRRPHLTQDTPT